MKRGKLSEDFVDSDSDAEVGQSISQDSNSKAASEKPSKSVKTDKAVESASSDEVSFELSAKRRVTVRKFRSSVLIDIREFYEDKASGEMRPGSKGIALSKEQYSKLKELLSEIDDAIKKIE